MGPGAPFSPLSLALGEASSVGITLPHLVLSVSPAPPNPRPRGGVATGGALVTSLGHPGSAPWAPTGACG